MSTNPAFPLIEWYRSEGRSLPWRDEKSAYRIWISEIILQQTRVAQGLDYYRRFIGRFPDLKTLAAAPLDDVLKHWEGLGYYSRARNLHHTAKDLLENYGGEFPRDYRELMKLKGVGPYTARAIGSFAFGNATGVLDGNVFRVVSRYLRDPSPIDKGSTRKKFQARLDEWIRAADPAEFNQAMMDLGATVCHPRKPNCAACPLEVDCAAARAGVAETLPVKGKKLVRKSKYFNFFLALDEAGRIAIRQRPAKGVWAGLWEIPNIERPRAGWDFDPMQSGDPLLGEMKHVFTHFDMHIRVYKKNPQNVDKAGRLKFIRRENISIFAFPRAVLKIFDDFLPEIL